MYQKFLGVIMNQEQKAEIIKLIKQYGFWKESQGTWSTINATRKDNPDSREQEAKEKSDNLYNEIYDIIMSGEN